MTASQARQVVYGVLAATGLVLTQYFNFTYTGPPGYLQAWFANSASSSAAVDLLVVAVAAAVFMIVEGRRLGMRVPWLLMRERAMRPQTGVEDSYGQNRARVAPGGPVRSAEASTAVDVLQQLTGSVGLVPSLVPPLRRAGERPPGEGTAAGGKGQSERGHTEQGDEHGT